MQFCYFSKNTCMYIYNICYSQNNQDAWNINKADYYIITIVTVNRTNWCHLQTMTLQTYNVDTKTVLWSEILIHVGLICSYSKGCLLDCTCMS